ncbi:glycoside hydrolase family 3 C-terminal domain-containing protein [Paenibacillus sp. MZ04-78.2]|uniref:beta-glucosidase family protein n=1 Tax=Paenibacillus sp. MZ04-78.2 TaxID=2962034 RepID=UPI0020B6B318|nr:glycoside hydrolase family 3 C-terminal domain-containing protein [Paenibacillus sp. MZ04-78.2]MCP3772732.1 glycoside hydrolase family 3 C-terminal domain-containing protein [Paenibacillus sp. MZ04-78.2]
MQRDIRQLISQMTVEEKAGLCSGLNFWQTKPVERLGIPSIMLTDGPHGLRKQRGGLDHLGFADSVPATCFPSAAGLACSWDRKLMEQVGIALGEECQAEDVAILLGPAANIKRSPLCGRNFEYFSEDPYLSSEMAAYHIKGVQSQGVGTSLKHFAVNNQEHRRMTVGAVVDERTLREIYLASFEGAVKQAQPWTVMCAYNKVNGEYCSEHEDLLTRILKEEWGHEGFVVSDWGAVNDRAKGLAAGLELEMPSSNGLGDRKIVDAVKSGKLSEEALDKAVERILRVVFQAVDRKKEHASFDAEAHHGLARTVARESMVLLKNEDGILPLKKKGTIAVIGALAKHPRYQGGGSSHINPTRLDDIYEEMRRAAGSEAAIVYAEGYLLESDDIDDRLLQEAKLAAAQAEAAVIFAGLPERYESEAYDRQHLRIPDNHRKLIEAVAEVQSNVVVVLSNGAPVEMPWIDRVKGVLEGYLGGQAIGGAIADLLFGDANPCGKLAETFPKQLSHNPSHLNFPGEGDKVEYKEGLFVGYRYYDAKQIEPLFPFGHGLSYTTFEYTGLIVDKREIRDTETVRIGVRVRNTGELPGKEIVQLYVRDVEASVIRPEKELKGFEKVELAPGEEKTVEFVLDKRAFAYYNPEMQDWHVESGDFEILIGKSSAELVLQGTIRVQSSVRLKKTATRNSLVGDLLDDPQLSPIFREMLRKYSENKVMSALEEDGSDMMLEFVRNMPLRVLAAFSQGAVTEEMLEADLQRLNEIGE